MSSRTTYEDLCDAGVTELVMCPICTGDDDAPPCSPECEAIVERVRARREAISLEDAIAKAEGLARRYIAEGDDETDDRVVAVRVQVRMWREELARARTASTMPAPAGGEEAA